MAIVNKFPNLRQISFVNSPMDGKIYIIQTDPKDRKKVLQRLDVTDVFLTVTLQNLAQGVPRHETHFTTVRMPSGNYRVYIREISDIEADKFCEEYLVEKAELGEE